MVIICISPELVLYYQNISANWSPLTEQETAFTGSFSDVLGCPRLSLKCYRWLSCVLQVWRPSFPFGHWASEWTFCSYSSFRCSGVLLHEGLPNCAKPFINCICYSLPKNRKCRPNRTVSSWYWFFKCRSWFTLVQLVRSVLCQLEFYSEYWIDLQD